MDGLRGYQGWRWIFILEGTLTCVVSLAFFFLIPTFPEDAKWLTPEERAFVSARLQQEQGRSALERKITMKGVIQVFKDPKILIGGFMYFGLVVRMPQGSLLGCPLIGEPGPSIWLCLFLPRHHPKLWIQSNPNTAALCPTLGYSLWFRDADSLLLRQDEASLLIHAHSNLCRPRRLCDFTYCA